MAKQAPIRFGDGLGQIKPLFHPFKFISITHSYLLLWVWLLDRAIDGADYEH
jgi:hypothetical protein